MAAEVWVPGLGNILRWRNCVIVITIVDSIPFSYIFYVFVFYTKYVCLELCWFALVRECDFVCAVPPFV